MWRKALKNRLIAKQQHQTSEGKHSTTGWFQNSSIKQVKENTKRPADCEAAESNRYTLPKKSTREGKHIKPADCETAESNRWRNTLKDRLIAKQQYQTHRRGMLACVKLAQGLLVLTLLIAVHSNIRVASRPPTTPPTQLASSMHHKFRIQSMLGKCTEMRTPDLIGKFNYAGYNKCQVSAKISSLIASVSFCLSLLGVCHLEWRFCLTSQWEQYRQIIVLLLIRPSSTSINVDVIHKFVLFEQWWIIHGSYFLWL